MCLNREDEIRAAASDWWSLLRVPRGQKGTRTPLLCILEPINKVSIGSENILCKISDLNLDFDYVLQNGSRIMFRHEDETREYQNKLTTLHGTRELLGPYSLRARTTKINSCLDLYFGRSLELLKETYQSKFCSCESMSDIFFKSMSGNKIHERIFFKHVRSVFSFLHVSDFYFHACPFRECENAPIEATRK